MIICDLCKKIPRGTKNEPFLYEIAGTKMEETKTGKRGTASGREMIKIPMHLCDGCISRFNQFLGQYINDLRNSENSIDEKVAEFVASRSKDRDKGIDDPDLLVNRDFVSQA